MLATSHAPLRGMTIMHETEVNRTLVDSLAASLLAEAPRELAQVVNGELGNRDWSTLTNVRDLWFELYDVVQPHIVQAHVPQTQVSQAQLVPPMNRTVHQQVFEEQR